ncbi:hypothetical protein DNR46_33605 [Mesorhizobium japonicum]|uniref:Uncharacterized protein n=1 Tax=Mesorhizobium japonicum TaxID=2066070 RepID=A0A3M9X1Q8_9HYPH|nr:hypothetical protein DNR46_33605 [Mesorhizobium japonicum]
MATLLRYRSLAAPPSRPPATRRQKHGIIMYLSDANGRLVPLCPFPLRQRSFLHRWIGNAQEPTTPAFNTRALVGVVLVSVFGGGWSWSGHYNGQRRGSKYRSWPVRPQFLEPRAPHSVFF